MESKGHRLADSAGFEILRADLARDVEVSLAKSLAGGAIFPGGGEPLSIFHATLATSIRDVEKHPRGILLQKFLKNGPYDREGEIPSELAGNFLSDQETALATAFVHTHMINSFQGALAELLAAFPCQLILEQGQKEGKIPREARLYVGDAVTVSLEERLGKAKGADFHILMAGCDHHGGADTTVVGVGEVKSYQISSRRLQEQIKKHLSRVRRGLRIGEVIYEKGRVAVGYGRARTVLKFAVVPASWKLPRSFHFDETGGGRVLQVDRGGPPEDGDHIQQLSDSEWKITLRWSKEALADAAHEMTFWYMAKSGEVIYRSATPTGWSKMTPSEAGQNAAKMMLYYAILRARTPAQAQRAIALYNSYCFGYALGTGFKDTEGRREMLWPEDLDEIHTSGKTKHGCRIEG